MCGIFGYVGTRSAQPILLEGLRTLEYRGYDSAGVFIPGFGVKKSAGPIAELIKICTEPTTGTSGIAHTRWATHGQPTVANAHPHHDMSESLWLVHNGIIENHQEIKEGLRARGITFYSDTDTEVLVKLIGTFHQGDLRQAVQAALQVVRGAYGLAVMYEHDPDSIVVARLGSPLVLGLGTDGNFIASDPSALLAHTKDVIYLEDGDIALVSKDSYDVINQRGIPTTRNSITVDWSIEQVQKDGYPHFMLKEIHEAPEVVINSTRGRLLPEAGNAKLGGFDSILDQLSKLQRLHIVGCGSAYYAGLVCKYLLEEYANLPVEVDLASEYRYKKTHPDKNTAVLAISQSGETADTLASLQKAKQQKLLTLGVVNAVGSAIARETDAGVYNHAGPEVAVASTKAFISQLTVSTLITLVIGRQRGLDRAQGQAIAQAIHTLPDLLTTTLQLEDQIKAIAREYQAVENMMFIGRKLHTPIAYEGALKVKEVSYIHAEGYAGGELKHGPIALLDSSFPVVALAPHDDVFSKMLANIEEVHARQAPLIVVTTTEAPNLHSITPHVLVTPQTHPSIQPIISTLVIQLLAYHLGVARGHNVDRPRNLAKSVTVE